MKYGDVVNLAWDLADAVTPELSESTRAAIFTALGAGELDPTITALIHECRRAREYLSPELAARVRMWVDAYVDQGDLSHVRQLVQTITGDPEVLPRPNVPARLIAARASRRRATTGRVGASQ
jgi:hypothetical protein